MVYDVTKYLNDHPGGPEVMLDYAGENILYWEHSLQRKFWTR